MRTILGIIILLCLAILLTPICQRLWDRIVKYVTAYYNDFSKPPVNPQPPVNPPKEDTNDTDTQ